MSKKNYARLLSVAFAGALACGNVQAQDEFDLTSQRSEVQDVLPVPGKKVNHGGIIINPTPQKMFIDDNGFINFGDGVCLKDKKGKFANDLGFTKIAKKGVRLYIDFGSKVSAKKDVKQVSGAYSLSVNKKGIEIIGYDERGAFYGLQTLRELFESPAMKNGKMPYVEINDYPNLPNRGVVEGFYGEPWSHKVRLSLIDFYGKFKMNTYIYGPKDDPYHSSPNWRVAYPEKEAKNLKELVDACNRNRVDFVWAIHPGKDIKWNEEDYNNLVNKLNMMYDLGVRHFAVFFDDISGEGTNPYKQTELLNRLTNEFVNVKGDVSPLTVCPTDYSRYWAKPGENGPLAIYGRTLDPGVKVFWTGDVVCSDLTPNTLEFINSRIKRPAYFWWNFPVTDYARHILLQGPVYGLDTTLTDKETCGVLSNPMEHGEASKLALYGVADYTWNGKAYNAMDNWERGLEELMPEASDAYRTFAIHSSDTENGYRRSESWETDIFRLNNWDDAAADALEKEYIKVEGTPAVLEQKCSNKLLLGELRPWLTEFAKLGTRGKHAVELGRMFRAGDDDAMFWQKYVENMMSAEDRKAYDAHKSGTMKLQPFYENMMDDMGHEYLKKLSGSTPCDYKGIGSFTNSGTSQTKLMLDEDSISHYTSGMAQRPNDWIGLDLRDVRDVKEIEILQGRNSVDDVDYFDHVLLECSADGKHWTTLIDDMKKQYVINWKAEPVKARFVRLRRLDSEKTNYAAVRTFRVNPLRVSDLGFSLESDSNEQALKAFDNNLSTSYDCSKEMTFGVNDGVSAYIILMNKLNQPVKCSQLDAKGKVVKETTLTSAYAKIERAGKNVAKIKLTGEAEIFEIVPVSCDKCSK